MNHPAKTEHFNEAFHPQNREELLRTEEAAQSMRLQPTTLEAWRCRGGGPPYLKLGKAVRYRRGDLENFMESRLRTNTGETRDSETGRG